MPKGKYFWLQSHLNSLCLDLSYGKAEPENEVITWEYKDVPHQQWFEDLPHHVIRSRADENLVLEERGDGRVIINTFQPGREQQQWIVEDNRICRKDEQHRVLHIVDSQEAHAGRLCVEDFDDKAEQKWKAVHLEGPGYFVITSVMHGKALDIERGSRSAGATLIIWDRHDKANQQWYEDKHGYIRSRVNDYTFNISDGHLKMDDTDHNGATWMRSGNAILNKYDAEQCLEVEGACEDNCAKLVQGRYYENANQRWDFHFI